MRDVYLIGSYSTVFKRWPEKSIKDLTREAYLGAIEDSGLDSSAVQSAWFSNCGWGHDMPAVDDDPARPGQMNVRGQSALAPLVTEGLFPKRAPIMNVEGACASGSLAFLGAWKDVLSGSCDAALAIGVEKTYYPKFLLQVMKLFEGGTDVESAAATAERCAALCARTGREWSPGPGRTIFMDFYGMLAAWHMWRYGTTREQLAMAASKNHFHGALNPLAQYRFEVPVDKVLADYEVSWPLTRSMCAPLGDGAAAALLCSAEYWRGLPDSVKKRSVRAPASVSATGYVHDVEEFSTSHFAAQKAYRLAGIEPGDISLAEVHDATAFAEIHQLEQLGFCPLGEGGRVTESGATRFDGRIPINTSGGLESKGHPIGATGLSQINEIVTQLRGEAGARQVAAPVVGLVENGGGLVGYEEFCCVVTILERPLA